MSALDDFIRHDRFCKIYSESEGCQCGASEALADLAALRETLADVRDLARTGLPLDGFPLEHWKDNKLNRIAAMCDAALQDQEQPPLPPELSPATSVFCMSVGGVMKLYVFQGISYWQAGCELRRHLSRTYDPNSLMDPDFHSRLGFDFQYCCATEIRPDGTVLEHAQSKDTVIIERLGALKDGSPTPEMGGGEAKTDPGHANLRDSKEPA
jgi:hypothetical protein